MSEFQHYEFYSVDKELSKSDRKEIGSWSSRTMPTSRKATFNYSYGDFPKDEEKVLLKYFDAFFYIANWGTRRLMFKLPKDLVDYKFIKQYEAKVLDDYETGLKMYQKSGSVIIDIRFYEEDGFGWIDEEQLWLTELLPIRNDILNKDYRSLFVIWLLVLEIKYSYEDLDSEYEIDQALIPTNLEKLNPALESLVDFFDISTDWINAAAKFCASKKQAVNFESKIKALSDKKKNEYLLRLINEEHNLSIKLKNEISEERSNEMESSKISMDQFLKAVEEATEKRKKKKTKDDKKKHLKRMKSLAENELEIKKKIKQNITRGTGKSYDDALKSILDLKDLYIHQDQVANFKSYVRRLRVKYSSRPAMIRRLESIELGK